MTEGSRVHVEPLGAVGAGSTLWTYRSAAGLEKRYLTIVVRATFRFGAGAPLLLAEPEPVVAREQVDLDGFVREPGDLAPFLPMAELWVRGHAPVRPGASELRARVMLVRRGQKVLERGLVRAAPRGASVVRVSELGPLSAKSPERLQRLRGASPEPLDAPEPALYEGLDLSYFQAAPEGQRLRELAGDERLVLEGLVAGAARHEVELPGARGVARVYGLVGTRTAPLALRLDTVGVDLDRGRLHLLYRGNLELAALDRPLELAAAAGIELGAPLPFPRWVEPKQPLLTEKRVSALEAAATQRFDPAMLGASAGQRAPAAPSKREPPQLAGLTAEVGDGRAPARESALPFREGEASLPPPSQKEHAPTGTLELGDASLSEVLGADPLPFDARRAPPRAHGPAPSPSARSMAAPVPSAPTAAPRLDPLASATLGVDETSLAALLGASTPFVEAAPPAPRRAKTGSFAELRGLAPPSPGPPPPAAASHPAAPPHEPEPQPPHTPLGAPPALESTVFGVSLDEVLAAAATPFEKGAAQAEAPPPRAPEPSVDARASASAGLTLGADELSLVELLRPVVPFKAPAHLGPRAAVLREGPARAKRKPSEHFLEALRELGVA